MALACHVSAMRAPAPGVEPCPWPLLAFGCWGRRWPVWWLSAMLAVCGRGWLSGLFVLLPDGITCTRWLPCLRISGIGGVVRVPFV